MRRLNIGCGPDVRQGWANLDRDRYEGAWRGDPLEGLRFRDNTFDGAVAHHVLQMVAWPDLVPWLAEVRRVLKPGAWLRITVPDLFGAINAWQRLDRAWFPISDEHEATVDGKLCLYVSQAGTTRSVFTARWLTDLCHRAGFGCAVPITPPGASYAPGWLTDLDSRLDESIVVEACK